MKRLKHSFSFFLLSLLGFTAQSQSEVKPRLVVGIVVDQMRNDYIYRYWDRYGNGGFKRLVNEGYHFRNAHYNYIPTITGPGHSSIYTGTTPRTHGVIANDWFVRSSGSYVGCVSDTAVRTVGAEGKNGKASPKNQLTSTIGDELKMSSNKKAKVFSVSLKDRSAILPAGHAADAAFWHDDATGRFISSTWYIQQLPAWVEEFNKKELVKNYLKMGWQPLYPLDSYTASLTDENKYESASNGKEKPIFPYEYSQHLKKGDFGIIKETPFGNTLVKEMAMACLKNEQLGKDDVTDLFCISFSSTDYVAHDYGPRALEVEDVYLRLDLDLEELLNALDKEVGKGNYTVFLTADHGAADVPAHLNDNKIPAGLTNRKKTAQLLRKYYQDNYGDSLLLSEFGNEQVFLNENQLRKNKLDRDEVEKQTARFLITLLGIAEAYSSSELISNPFPENDYRAMLQRGYNHRLSGNVAVIYAPGWIDRKNTGTTHGAGYNYDTHIPILFYGAGIKKGFSWDYTAITQIAPTVCELLKVNQTSGTIAQPLNAYFR